MLTKRNLAIAMLLVVVLPLSIYILSLQWEGFLISRSPSQRTPQKFETLFNESLSDRGLSVDFSAVSYTSGINDLLPNLPYRTKTVPVKNPDGAGIALTIYLTTRGSRLSGVLVEQRVASGEQADMESLLAITQTLFAIFAPGLVSHSEELEFSHFDSESSGRYSTVYEAMTFQELIQTCSNTFAETDAENEFFFFTGPISEDEGCLSSFVAKSKPEGALEIKSLWFEPIN